MARLKSRPFKSSPFSSSSEAPRYSERQQQGPYSIQQLLLRTHSCGERLLGDGFDSAQEEEVAGDSDEEIDGGDTEGPRIRSRHGHDVAGDEGGGDSGELVGEVDDD